MKPKHFAILLIATLLMAAAPPRQLPQQPTTLFGQFVEGVKSLNPFARYRTAPQGRQMAPRAQAPRAGAPAQRPAQQVEMRRDNNVRPATALEPTTRPSLPVKRAPRPERAPRSRTVSEYMAEEKP